MTHNKTNVLSIVSEIKVCTKLLNHVNTRTYDNKSFETKRVLSYCFTKDVLHLEFTNA